MEATANIGVEDLLPKNGPNNLGTGLNPNGVVHPSFVVGKARAMEIHAAEPDEHNGQVAEVSTKDFTRYIFEVTGMTIEVVSVGVKVPNPSGSFGKRCEWSVD